MGAPHAVSAPVLLLTGPPGVGKTTAIKKVVDLIGDHAGGFYTREVRINGRRTGFEIVTLSGETAPLAVKASSAAFPREQVFKGYRVNLDAIDQLAAPALVHAASAGKIVIVDEIGPMEILSRRFCQAVWDLLGNNRVAIVGAIVQRPDRFADRVKAHPRVTLRVLTPHNREAVPGEIRELVTKA